MSRMGMIIKRARTEMGLSQMDLAREMKLKSAQYISNVERGVSPLAPRWFDYISKRLAIPMNTLKRVYLDDRRRMLDQMTE